MKALALIIIIAVAALFLAAPVAACDYAQLAVPVCGYAAPAVAAPVYGPPAVVLGYKVQRVKVQAVRVEQVYYAPQPVQLNVNAGPRFPVAAAVAAAVVARPQRRGVGFIGIGAFRVND